MQDELRQESPQVESLRMEFGFTGALTRILHFNTVAVNRSAAHSNIRYVI